ncbi:MAG: hypothetical protein J7501_04200 [Bdellovibrio sp.]|nr:hypothetical protein [Bdellovibrio sp.]
MRYLFILAFLALSACATYEITPSGRALRTEDEYFEIVEDNSDRTTRYSGLYNVLEMQGTLLNTAVSEAQLDQQARYYLWDETKYNSEQTKRQESLNRETEIFLSFFTPERKNDDMDKNSTVWKTFLDVDGRRYEGRVTKLKKALPELTSLYPTHNRFFTPYSLVFPVPVKSIENKDIKLTVTGPVGSGVLHFKPTKK